MLHFIISKLQATFAYKTRALACLFASMAVWMVNSAHAQTALSEAQLKSALVLNFARYVDWPETSFASASDEVVVCLLGRDTLGGTLAGLETKQIRNRAIKVKTGVSGDDVRACHVAFISDSEERRMVPLLRSLANKPILTVSDIAGFVEAGGAIGIVQGETRLQFDVNRRVLEQSQLRASSNLLKLARNLNEPSGKN
jgi:YfiR/HmsC-like